MTDNQETYSAETAREFTAIELLALFHRAAKMFGRAHHRHGSSPHGQRRVLTTLTETGPISQRELLEILDVRSSSLSEVLAKLEGHGFVARERDERDKRNYIISLTEEATAFMAGHEEGMQAGAQAMFSGFDDEERRQLGALLIKLNHSLADLCEGADGPERGCRHGRGRHGHGRGDDGCHGPGHRGHGPRGHGRNSKLDSRRF